MNSHPRTLARASVSGSEGVILLPPSDSSNFTIMLSKKMPIFKTK